MWLLCFLGVLAATYPATVVVFRHCTSLRGRLWWLWGLMAIAFTLGILWTHDPHATSGCVLGVSNGVALAAVTRGRRAMRHGDEPGADACGRGGQPGQ